MNKLKFLNLNSKVKSGFNQSLERSLCSDEDSANNFWKVQRFKKIRMPELKRNVSLTDYIHSHTHSMKLFSIVVHTNAVSMNVKCESSIILASYPKKSGCNQLRKNM